MDIDPRRLGIGAQIQIALTLVGRAAERRDDHGGRGADCPDHRGTAAGRILGGPQKKGNKGK